MQLERTAEQRDDWSETVPTAIDLRVVGLVIATGALAASVNVPNGGVAMAGVAFLLLAGGGVAVHLLGERKLRRITSELLIRWDENGGTIEDVTRTTAGARTEWVVHTPDGDVTVGGLALAPMTRLSVEWDGVGDTMDASEAAENIDHLAETLYEEIFEIGATDKQTR